MQLQLRGQEQLSLDQLHVLVAEGYRQSYNIGILEKMLSVSKIDDELEAANGGGTFLPVLRTYSVNNDQIQGKMDEAAEGLLGSYRTLMQQLVGRAIEFTPEVEDNPAESAWVVSQDADDLMPEERVAYLDDNDVVVGTVGALSLSEGVIAVLPRKDSILFRERSMVCVKAAGFTGRHIHIRGKMQTPAQNKGFVTIRKKERTEAAKSGETALFSKLPGSLYFRVLLPNSLERIRV